MSNYVKPQSPIYNRKTDTYLYPLTTADQVIMPDGSRFTNINIEGAIQKNYSVVDNLTKPENENEFTQNMIWIDTDTSIKKVFFSNNEPNEILVDGDIWITTGNSSNVTFNALKANNEYINEICPVSVKQYVSGAWVDKIAKSYQNDEWIDWWDGELYKDGKLYNVLVDGFEKLGTTTVIKYNNGYFIYYDPGTGNGIASPEKINVTGYKTISVTGGLTYSSGGIGYFKMGLATAKSTTSFVSSVQFTNGNTIQEYSIEIPSDGGEYYLVFTCGGSTSATNCVKIEEIIMNK